MAAAAARFFDSDLWWSFSRSPVAGLSAVVALLCIGGAVLAPWIAPQNPFDLATLHLSDAFKPPGWAEEGDAACPPAAAPPPRPGPQRVAPAPPPPPTLGTPTSPRVGRRRAPRPARLARTARG